MSKVKLYIARHGKTMFNTIGRAQGWSDSPLTPFGEEGIRELGVGLKAAGISFKQAYILVIQVERFKPWISFYVRRVWEPFLINVTNVSVSGVLVV